VISRNAGSTSNSQLRYNCRPRKRCATEFDHDCRLYHRHRNQTSFPILRYMVPNRRPMKRHSEKNGARQNTILASLARRCSKRSPTCQNQPESVVVRLDNAMPFDLCCRQHSHRAFSSLAAPRTPRRYSSIFPNTMSLNQRANHTKDQQNQTIIKSITMVNINCGNKRNILELPTLMAYIL
jgi:hypothetical protein